jgi:hypothetical protein
MKSHTAGRLSILLCMIAVLVMSTTGAAAKNGHSNKGKGKGQGHGNKTCLVPHPPRESLQRAHDLRRRHGAVALTCVTATCSASAPRSAPAAVPGTSLPRGPVLQPSGRRLRSSLARRLRRRAQRVSVDRGSRLRMRRRHVQQLVLRGRRRRGNVRSGRRARSASRAAARPESSCDEGSFCRHQTGTCDTAVRRHLLPVAADLPAHRGSRLWMRRHDVRQRVPRRRGGRRCERRRRLRADGRACGGANPACAAGTFCKKPDGACAADATGVCQPIEATCPGIVDPGLRVRREHVLESVRGRRGGRHDQPRRRVRTP